MDARTACDKHWKASVSVFVVVLIINLIWIVYGDGTNNETIARTLMFLTGIAGILTLYRFYAMIRYGEKRKAEVKIN